jgi:hypothetical protein
MSDKITNLQDRLSKKDLELILEVNKKAIEIETQVVDQNEEVINYLEASEKRTEVLEEKVDKIVKQTEETNKDLFKIQVLFITGLLSLVIQIIQIFTRK